MAGMMRRLWLALGVDLGFQPGDQHIRGCTGYYKPAWNLVIWYGRDPRDGWRSWAFLYRLGLTA